MNKNKYIVFDTETTGLNVETDRIVEFASITKSLVDNEFHEEINHFLDPEMVISEGATKKHNIKNEDVAGKQKFRDISKQLVDVFNSHIKDNDCYYLGYNVLEYDIPLLESEFSRNGFDGFKIDEARTIDLLIFVQYYFRNFESNRLDDVYKSLFEKEPENAHQALDDTKTTWQIFSALIDTELLPRNVNKLLKQQELFKEFLSRERKTYGYWLYCDRQDKNILRIGAGKHRGALLSEVPTSYLKYIYEDPKFNLTPKTKKEFENIIFKTKNLVDN